MGPVSMPAESKQQHLATAPLRASPPHAPVKHDLLEVSVQSGASTQQKLIHVMHVPTSPVLQHIFGISSGLPIGWKIKELTECRPVPRLRYSAAMYALAISEWAMWDPTLQATVEGSNTPSLIPAYLFSRSEV